MLSFVDLILLMLTFYALIWFFDSFFKSCMHYPYYAFLEGSGLRIGFLTVNWTTTACNRFIFRWGKSLSRFLRRWFTCGYYITLGLFLPFAIWTLFSFIYNNLYGTVNVYSGPDVKVMVPGLSIPTSDFWIYFLAIAISSVLHELGHALAAVQEDVSLLAVGFSIMAIIPMAFVHLNQESMNALTISKRMKIFCAGIWHNLVTAFITLLLFFSSPILFSIGYETDVGVRVIGFEYGSPLRNTRGLKEQDVIVALNSCPIKNLEDWNECLYKAHERFGFCTSANYVSTHDESITETIKDNVVECCKKEDIYNLCFEYMESKHTDSVVMAPQYMCLKPREMIQDSFTKCNEAGGYNCPNHNLCLVPCLSNNTHMMVVQRKDNKHVLYLGVPYDFHKTVYVDQYFPRNGIFAEFSPKDLEKFMYYLFVFSLGIAFLNILPCYGSDGHYIARSMIESLAKHWNKDAQFVNFYSTCTVLVTTFLMVPSLIFMYFKAMNER